MILNAHVPIQHAKFGDQVRYYWEGSMQVDLVWNFAPRPDGAIEVLTGQRILAPGQVLEILRPITVAPGDIWVTECGNKVRILETSAPGLNPIVGLILYEHTSRVRQFSACGVCNQGNFSLHRPLDLCPELEETV